MNIKNIFQIILKILFFPITLAHFVWKKGESSLSKVIATTFTLLITFPFWLLFLYIGNNLLTGNYSNVKKPNQIISPTPSIQCGPKQIHQRNLIITNLKILDDKIASISSQITQEQNKKLTAVKLKTLDEFRAGVPKSD